MSETAKKKLVEVALPLEEINAACKSDKAVKTGSIRNLHKWFAPAPLPAWRALLFASMIDDPGDETRRAELLDLIKRLVANGADLPDDDTIEEAREVIRQQFPEGAPIVMDPFCGGGSTLVEAQRLGLPTYGSDLNPVPVLITRTLTELLPKVHGQGPLHPEPEGAPKVRGRGKRTGYSDHPTLMPDSGRTKTYTGYDGLASDVLYYAAEIQALAWSELSAHYPSQPRETSIAWLWARTVTCPNPACRIETILTTSWWLSKKEGDLAWIEPEVKDGRIDLAVVHGGAREGAPAAPKIGRAVFACISCQSPIDEKQVRAEAMAGRLGLRMTAIIAEQSGKRIYRSPLPEEEASATAVSVESELFDVPLVGYTRDIRPVLYGFSSHGSLYTSRQLLALTTLTDLVAASHGQIINDGGTKEWADAVTSLLAIAVGKLAQYNSTQVFLYTRNGPSAAKAAFGRNDLPMTWDFVETATFGESIGSLSAVITNMLRALVFAPHGHGTVERVDARASKAPAPSLVATDPPYFDAIGYADLSDYFYVWHRRALKDVFPDLYGTVAAPKSNELTAIPSHHGGSKEAARSYFISGFTETFANLRRSMDEHLPMLVIYASKEQQSGHGEETRWESILTAMMNADLEITGTWPIHMTTSVRMISAGTNAVASYVVMVCRHRDASATTISLSDFSRALRRELPRSIRNLQAASILPVDLYQAALGPGMEIYSRYRKVEDSQGNRVAVGKALELIRNAIGEVLDEQEGELDAASRFAVTWWEQYGWDAGPFGEADKVARQYGTHVDEVFRSEVVTSGSGKVQLLGAEDLDRNWSPVSDSLPTAWEAVHHLSDRLVDGGGETEAATLLAQLGPLQDSTRTLAYRLHDIAAKNGRTKDQERYNALIGQWSSMLALAATHNPEGLF